MTSRLETKIYSQRVRRIPGCVGDAIARDAIRVPDPRTAAAYVNRGRAYFAKGEIGKAMDDFDQAILISPYMSDGYFYRGTTFFHQGNMIWLWPTLSGDPDQSVPLLKHTLLEG